MVNNDHLMIWLVAEKTIRSWGSWVGHGSARRLTSSINVPCCGMTSWDTMAAVGFRLRAVVLIRQSGPNLTNKKRQLAGTTPLGAHIDPNNWQIPFKWYPSSLIVGQQTPSTGPWHDSWACEVTRRMEGAMRRMRPGWEIWNTSLGCSWDTLSREETGSSGRFKRSSWSRSRSSHDPVMNLMIFLVCRKA